MAKALFKVEKPGLYASIQDKGRFGYQQYGVPVSGAIDRYAHYMANYIIDNKSNAATIEITILGTELKVLSDHIITITGADLMATVDGVEVSLWKAFKVYKGQRLLFKKPRMGARAYIGVSGGIQGDPILGSWSTFERGKIFDRLRTDDVIEACDSGLIMSSKELISKWIPTYNQDIEVRVIPSHHERCFEQGSVNQFYNQIYTYKKGDRMGCMIQGEKPLIHKNGADIISECTSFGTIQVPSSGQPIILLAESQTTGGYTTIGTVVSADLWKIAQLLPQGKIKFKRIGLNESKQVNEFSY